MPPDMLWTYETETHFCTWPGEAGRSVSTERARPRGVREVRGGPSLAGGSADDQQDRHLVVWAATPGRLVDGSLACLAVLRDQCRRPGSCRLRRWTSRPLSQPGSHGVLNTQRLDGSWGIWGGTAEETAYALQILALTGDLVDRDITPVIKVGTEYMVTYSAEHPALWHDKDLDRPGSPWCALHLAAHWHLGHQTKGPRLVRRNSLTIRIREDRRFVMLHWIAKPVLSRRAPWCYAFCKATEARRDPRR